MPPLLFLQFKKNIARISIYCIIILIIINEA